MMGTTINCLIVGNCFFLALEHHHQPQWLTTVIKNAEITFCFCFLTEALAKMAGMGGLLWYFREFSNVFDFTLVVTALPEALATIFGWEARSSPYAQP